MAVAPFRLRRNVVSVLCVHCRLCGLVLQTLGNSLDVSVRPAGPELPSPLSATLPVPVLVLVPVTGPGLSTLISEEKCTALITSLGPCKRRTE